MIGFNLPVTPLDTDEQVDRLLQIYATYANRRKANDPELTPIQALGIYFHQYGRGTESLIEQAAQLPRLPDQPMPARSDAGFGWHEQDDAVDALAKVTSALPQTPRSQR
jgi:hypothetical protein